MQWSSGIVCLEIEQLNFKQSLAAGGTSQTMGALSPHRPHHPVPTLAQLQSQNSAQIGN